VSVIASAVGTTLIRVLLVNRKQRPPMPPPHVLASLVPESAMFEDLLKMEQKLDWTILRKKAEVTDAIGKPVRVSLAK
jgi:SWI/SNF-related matrix-associated actin-dependent regulator of chromatin subfamily D